VRAIQKLTEGSPNAVDLIADGAIDLVINTPRGGPGARADGHEIRAAAIRAGVPCMTTIEAGQAAAAAIASRPAAAPVPLQDQGRRTTAGGAFRPGAARV
jgi:carbamoyl-phosphate synthase large subunit